MLSLSQAAARLVYDAAKRTGAEPKLRIRVIGGGCSGLTWDWALGDVGTRPGDLRRTTDGVTVVVDPESATFVRGATIDAGAVPVNGLRPALDPEGARTIVLRAVTGARSVCGCGESFAP